MSARSDTHVAVKKDIADDVGGKGSMESLENHFQQIVQNALGGKFFQAYHTRDLDMIKLFLYCLFVRTGCLVRRFEATF